MLRHECNLWREWLAHYREQGVTNFYVIDNNSTAWSHPSLGKMQCGYTGNNVTKFPWSRHSQTNVSNQVMAYNSVLSHISTDWLLVVDMDDFVFGTQETIAHQLRHTSSDIVCVPWLKYSSGGRLSHSSCTVRKNVLRSLRTEAIGKCAVRTSQVVQLHVHRHILKGEQYHARLNDRCTCADGSHCRSKPYPSHACAHSRLNSSRLRLHHYMFQSQEDMIRKGRDTEADLTRSRTSQYWKQMEKFAGIKDLTLARKSSCVLARIVVVTGYDVYFPLMLRALYPSFTVHIFATDDKTYDKCVNQTPFLCHEKKIMSRKSVLLYKLIALKRVLEAYNETTILLDKDAYFKNHWCVNTLLNRSEDVVVQIGGPPGCPHSTFNKLHINTGLLAVKPWALTLIQNIIRFHVNKYEHHCYEEEVFNQFVAKHGQWITFPSNMTVQEWTIGILNFTVWPDGIHKTNMRLTQNASHYDFWPDRAETCIHHDLRRKKILQS